MRILKYFKTIFLFIAASSPLFADDPGTHEVIFDPYPSPWFTGPLITPSPYTVDPGHYNIEPLIYAITDLGHYNKHWRPSSVDNFYRLRVGVNTKIGLAKALELHFVPIVVYQETQGQHSVNIEDMLVELEVQLLRPKKFSPIPTIKLSFQTDFPLGKYEHLNPKKKKTDATGTGCYFPGIRLSLGNFFHIGDFHFLELRWYGSYRIGNPTSVKGFNAYGGDAHTRGTEYPGNRLFVGAAIQYNLTQRWALACDARYNHSNKNRFSGKTMTAMKRPSSEEYSLAPAIEYNWSKNVGIIGGIWFSFAGRNVPQFVTGIVKINTYF